MAELAALKKRIGNLQHDAADKWWRITATVDPQAVADDFLKDVRDLVLPWMTQRLQECGCGSPNA